MTLRRVFASAFAIVLVAVAASEGAPKTLGQIRAELVGQSVVILGARGVTPDAMGTPLLFDWFRAIEESPDRRRLDPSTRVPYRLKGTTARVVEIRPSRLERQPRATDVFGDPVRDDVLVDPAFEIFLQALDGLIGTSTRYADLVGVRPLLELTSVIEIDRAAVERGLDRLYGTALYPVGYSVLYPPDADLSTLTDVRRLGRLRDVPNLTPLVIAKAMYVATEHAVVLRLEFGGRTALAFSPLRRAKPDETLLERVSTGFLTSMPRGLTDRELSAVRAGVVESGMSPTAVRYAWGFPDEIRGSTWIYKGRGRLTMFGDRAMFVTPER